MSSANSIPVSSIPVNRQLQLNQVRPVNRSNSDLLLACITTVALTMIATSVAASKYPGLPVLEGARAIGTALLAICALGYVFKNRSKHSTSASVGIPKNKIYIQPHPSSPESETLRNRIRSRLTSALENTYTVVENKDDADVCAIVQVNSSRYDFEASQVSSTSRQQNKRVVWWVLHMSPGERPMAESQFADLNIPLAYIRIGASGSLYDQSRSTRDMIRTINEALASTRRP